MRLNHRLVIHGPIMLFVQISHYYENHLNTDPFEIDLDFYLFQIYDLVFFHIVFRVKNFHFKHWFDFYCSGLEGLSGLK